MIEMQCVGNVGLVVAAGIAFAKAGGIRLIV